uniref:Chemokine interleukin-8-like domain-containing protein n=1 Tax=Stegastes partitus TaxID=144197 RepID=A0A3B5BC07_9TELE
VSCWLFSCLMIKLKFCCTQYQETQVPVKMLKSYRIQDNTGYCNIKAVVFRTKRNKNVCGNPDDEWVQKAKELIPRYDTVFTEPSLRTPTEKTPAATLIPDSINNGNMPLRFSANLSFRVASLLHSLNSVSPESCSHMRAYSLRNIVDSVQRGEVKVPNC